VSRALRPPIFVAAALASLYLCASAEAAPVIVGSPLTGTFIETDCGAIPCVFVQRSLPEAGALASSPVNGAIVAWHIIDGTSLHQYRLRVLSPAAGGAYAFSGTSAPETPSGPQLETFPAALPIQAGDLIGVELELGGRIGSRAAAGAEYTLFDPPPADGATATGFSDSGFEHGFNAEVQPAPTITAFGPTSGSTAGGASVTIGGTDFEGASAVKFGSAPAPSFHVNSEGQITAIVPAAAAGAVNVAVTTPAGTATSSQQFTYMPTATCIVPKLKGKKLKAARKALTKADCKLGKVTKPRGATVKTGKVKKQRPKPGKVLAPGSKVSVKLDG
jgi:hypothetical protein